MISSNVTIFRRGPKEVPSWPFQRQRIQGSKSPFYTCEELALATRAVAIDIRCNRPQCHADAPPFPRAASQGHLLPPLLPAWRAYRQNRPGLYMRPPGCHRLHSYSAFFLIKGSGRSGLVWSGLESWSSPRLLALLCAVSIKGCGVSSAEPRPRLSSLGSADPPCSSCPPLGVDGAPTAGAPPPPLTPPAHPLRILRLATGLNFRRQQY